MPGLATRSTPAPQMRTSSPCAETDIRAPRLQPEKRAENAGKPTGCRSMANVGQTKEKRRRPKAPPPLPPQLERLVERIRNVVERRIQLVADALHRADGGDGNQSGDQAVFDGGRALVVLNQLQKLDHLRSPTWLMTTKTPHPAHCTSRRSSRNLGDTG